MVNNGQLANQTTFNNGLASKSADNTLAGKQDLANAAAESGTTVINAQRELNGAASFSGRTLNGTKDQLPAWTDNSVGLSTNNLKDRAEALTTYAKATQDSKITGPASATDNALVRYDATTGKLAQNSGVIVDDSNNVTGINNLTANGVDHNIGTTNTATQVDIATGTGVNTVNIGGANTTINMVGTVNNQNVTNMNVTDKLVTFNDGGAVSSGFGSGFEVEENAVATGYVKTSGDRNSFEIKAPNTAGIASLTPGASNDTVALLAATQVFTNKDYDGGVASNARRFTLPKDTTTNLTALTRKEGTLLYSTDEDLVYYDDGTTLTAVGTGTGGGDGINYIALTGGQNADFEGGDTTGYVVYNDSAADPVDGTGGSVTGVTFAASGTSPIRGSFSSLFTKDAANRRGHGFSYDFTIDAADKGKVLQSYVEYFVNSGTYADDDIRFWIYDVTNAVMIQPAPFKLKNTGIIEKFPFEWQSSYNSTSYRLIGHISSTSAVAYELKFDRFFVGPAAKLYGSPITDWVSYTPTGSWVSNTTYSGTWRRVGDSMELNALVTATGIPTATGLTVSLPSGYSIDTSKITSTSTSVQQLGVASILDTGVVHYDVGSVLYNNTTSVTVRYNAGGTPSSTATLTNSAPFAFNSGDSVSLIFKVPILGWGSSAIMSSDADTRVVAAMLGAASVTTTMSTPGTLYKIALDTAIKDTHGGFSDANDRWVCPVPGFYFIHGQINLSMATADRIRANIYKNGASQIAMNGAATIDGNSAVSVSCLQELIAGDYIELFGAQDSSVSKTTVAGSGETFLHIHKLQGPSQIMASELVEAHYSTAAGQTIESGGSGEVLNFGTKITDSHGAVTTGASWKFTAPRAGTYSVKSAVEFAYTTGWAAGEYAILELFKNGVAAEYIAVDYYQGTSYNLFLGGSTDIKLIAGDYIHINVLQASGVSINLSASASLNYVSIISG